MKSQRKPAVVTAKVQSLQMTALCTNNDCQSAVTKPVVTVKVQSLPGAVKVQHLSRISYQGEAEDGQCEGACSSALREAAAVSRAPDAAAGPPCSWYVTNDFGHRLYGRPAIDGEGGAEHAFRPTAALA